MSARDPRERRLIASIAALSRHARVNGEEATRAARYASHVERFENLVDPERVLEPSERQRRTVAARRAHFKTLALKSAQARRKTSGLDDQR
jgi:hypothetical protein